MPYSCHFFMPCNWIHIHITFPFLTVWFLLFQNSSDLDVHSLDSSPPSTLPPPLSFLNAEGANVITSTGGGEGLKNKKEEWKYGAGASLLKRGHFPYLIFSRFIIFTFRNYLTLCKIVLYTFAKLCYAFEEKFFFLPP